MSELELNNIPKWLPDIEEMFTGEAAVASREILPSTPSLSPSPIRTVVPAWIWSTWLDSTRYPSGRLTVPDQTVVDLVCPVEETLKAGAIMNSNTIAAATDLLLESTRTTFAIRIQR